MADGYHDVRDIEYEEEKEPEEIILPEILFGYELQRFLKLRKKLIKNKPCQADWKYRRMMKRYRNYSMLLSV